MQDGSTALHLAPTATEILRDADPSLHRAIAVMVEICKVCGEEGEQLLTVKPGCNNRVALLIKAAQDRIVAVSFD